MQFSTPRTKEQMYRTLQEIFYYYRIRREAWEGIELQPLVIERLTFTPLSDEDKTDLAQTLLAPTLSLKKYESIQQLILAKSSLTCQLATISQKVNQTEIELINFYDKQVEELRKNIVKLGTAHTTIETTEINKLRSKQSEEIAKLWEEHNLQISKIEGEIQALQNKIDEAETFFENLKQQEITKKVREIKLDEIAKIDEVNKYNISASEKELRYANEILVKQANFDLRFRELSQEFFTKDQLIEMGYYKDVLNCICGYYNTLSASVAYQDFSNETGVIVYLEDYYTDVLYLYRARAGQ